MPGQSQNTLYFPPLVVECLVLFVGRLMIPIRVDQRKTKRVGGGEGWGNLVGTQCGKSENTPGQPGETFSNT